jgi:HK97 family phage portal protein
MTLWERLTGTAQAPMAPKAAYQPAGGGVLISTLSEIGAALSGQQTTASGHAVSPDSALQIAAFYACVRIISGAVATLPLHVKKRVDDRTRNDASDDPLWQLLRRKPNKWQTPSQFRRMMQAHLLLRGNAYALKVKSALKPGVVLELVPLHPDRVTVEQNDDLSLTYTVSKKNGSPTTYQQDDIMHLVGLTLDGVKGVSVITYARETLGLSLAMENHGASTFRRGLRTSVVLRHPGRLGKEGLDFLKATLDAYRSGGENEDKALILEEGMSSEKISMTAEDAQWIESRKFTRTDIAMFFGVPPHMIGDTEKATSWGTGIEQQSIGFTTYTLEDWLTTWEETVNRDLIPDSKPDLYAKFNRAAIVKGDLTARWESYVKGMQWGVYSPNEVRALEDWNPREGGDVYYPPPNTAGTPANSNPGKKNEPQKTA